MSQTTIPHIERACDVAVLGGSAAGLAAALQLGRQRRSVIVVDSGEPRNAPAAHMHGYLTRDGQPPAELAAIGREEVRSYGVEVLDGRAIEVAHVDDGRFGVHLTGGHTVFARRIVLATGIEDVLPEIDGLAERWGHDVIHCPFCHGYEVRDRSVVQLLTHPMGLRQSVLFAHLTDRLTVVLHGGVPADHPDLRPLVDAGVRLVDGRARGVVGAGDGALRGIELADGTMLEADAVVVGPLVRPRTQPVENLGVQLVEHTSGLGEVVEVSPQGETSVAGLYAAGNITDPSHQVLNAAAHGSWVGAMVGHDLAEIDLHDRPTATTNQAEWDRRYGGDPVWSGNPNGSLVAEVGERAPGSALDVGAGEGGDAVWLAERGWTVTATDISQRTLEHIADQAAARDLAIRCHHADANSPEAFGSDRFDLVAAHYASIPRTPDRRAVENVLGAVAPGGTLLVVGHDPGPMRTPIDVSERSRAFDVDAYVGVDEFVTAVETSPGWTVERHETRPRPAGHSPSSHHVDDVVLRARRHDG